MCLHARSLEDFARLHPATPALLHEVLCDLAMGARHMAALGFIHRDIKPANVLLQRQGGPAHGTMCAKLGDLGLAVRLPEGQAIMYNE